MYLGQMLPTSKTDSRGGKISRPERRGSDSPTGPTQRLQGGIMCSQFNYRFKDIKGQRFGRLVAESFHHWDDDRVAYWLCQCDCGGTHITSGRSLRRGHCLSCGCLLREARERLAIDLTGQRFDRLLVLEKAPRPESKKRGQYWTCRCDFGKLATVAAGHLARGDTRSCGCLIKDVRSLPWGQAAFNRLYRGYLHGAQKRKWDFALSKRQFHEIT